MMGHSEMMGGAAAHPGVAEMSDEQRADFAALRAGVGEGQAAVTGSTPVTESGADLAGEIAGLVLVFVAMAKPVLPCLERIYTPAATQTAAAAVAGLCRKYGWLQEGVAQGYGEELTAAVVLLPLAFATYKGAQEDLRLQNAVTEKIPVTLPGAAVIPGNGVKTVTFGAPMAGANDAMTEGVSNG